MGEKGEPEHEWLHSFRQVYYKADKVIEIKVNFDVHFKLRFCAACQAKSISHTKILH